ncbi:hypothetical protein QGP82_29860 [Leptothoe sp. LEGE 181152]|nr:hypothetical protein [Leptothoe sp. LEGE 181152]
MSHWLSKCFRQAIQNTVADSGDEASWRAGPISAFFRLNPPEGPQPPQKYDPVRRVTPKGVGLSLLIISVAVLSPTAAQAAKLTLGERAVIGLFRGAGGLLGPLSGDSGPSGMDTLANRISTAFPDHNLTVQVFDSYEGNIFNFQEVGSAQGLSFLNQFDDVGAIGLIGYSGGGLSAMRTATGQSPSPIDLLVQIDSYEPLTGRDQEDEVLPPNVQTGINYYQRRNRFNFFRPGWDLFDLGGASNVNGSENINVEELFGDRNITHRTIDDDTRLHDRIVQDIATHVLPNLTLPSHPPEVATEDTPLFATSAPVPVLSGLADTTDLSSSPVTLLAQSDAKSVSEPSLLLALGVVGSGLWAIRQQH